MSSSEVRKPGYARRFVWLSLFIVVLFGGYSAGWFYIADRVKKVAGTSVASLNEGGRAAECTNLDVRGFPFRLGVFCDSVAFEDPGRNVRVTAGSLRSAAQVYQPWHVITELDGPLRTAAPGLPPLWLDWDKLRASLRIARPVPERLSIEGEGLSAQTDPEDGDPLSLFSAERGEAHLRPNGADLDGAVSFVNLQIDPAAVAGRTLPVLSGSGDATLKDGVRLVETRVRSLRGQSGTIRNLDLSTGPETGVALSGPFSVDADGLIDANLTVTVRNPRGVSSALANAFPEARRQITAGFAGLAALGPAPSLPLRITKGRAVLGFLPLGEIPPL
ncbi:MAG TPA: DUF2125 domain-containing protein [Mesorhizobium sp.]|jgi:hypothetical protein|nr:DUF2125 domain-containing protein [Mesorhizobium sp.]